MLRMRVLGAVALCLVMVGCGSDDDGSQGAAAAVTGEFVGKATAEDAYVAVYTSNAKANGQFDVVAYVCNRQVPLEGSRELAEWFTGTGRNNTVDLKSQAGTSRLKATLTPGRVTGTVELPGGQTVSFEATSSADGPAGIFEVGLDDPGNLTGTSRGGKTMKLSPIQSGGEPGYRGTIASPGGASVPYDLFVRGGVITKQDLANMKAPGRSSCPTAPAAAFWIPLPRRAATARRSRGRKPLPRPHADRLEPERCVDQYQLGRAGGR